MRTPTLAAALALAAAVPAQAALQLYTNEADYLAAVGATTAFTGFDGAPGAEVPGNAFLPEVFFASCPTDFNSCGATVFHNSNAITDMGGSPAPNGVARVAGLFTVPVQAFGFNYISGGMGSLALITQGDGLAILNVGSTTAGFVGVVADSTIIAFGGVNHEFDTAGNRDRYFIDDFRINAPVPEPGTLLLAAAGVAMLMTRRRRG